MAPKIDPATDAKVRAALDAEQDDIVAQIAERPAPRASDIIARATGK